MWSVRSGRDPDDFAVLFGSIRSGEAVSPSWNIAPTDPVQIVLVEHALRHPERVAGLVLLSSNAPGRTTTRTRSHPGWRGACGRPIR